MQLERMSYSMMVRIPRPTEEWSDLAGADVVQPNEADCYSSSHEHRASDERRRHSHALSLGNGA